MNSETGWKYAALLSYRGSDFCGWQKQKGSAADGSPSIQETVEGALSSMTGETASVVGSGRTDSGVHAAGQVAHFILRNKEWPTEILYNGLNAKLPSSIRVLAVRPVPIEFHAQRSAIRKQYSYYFQQGSCALPHVEPVSWWIRKRLDLEAMNRALGTLVGEHDFAPFQASGAMVKSTVRRILEAEVVWEAMSFPGLTEVTGTALGFVRVRLVGTGFLKQMVRGIAGTLLQVGEGRRDAACLAEILASGRREDVGPTAPGRGLWLERVWYPDLEW